MKYTVTNVTLYLENSNETIVYYRSRDKKEKSIEKERVSKKNRDDSLLGDDDHEWSRPYGNRNIRKPSVSVTPQRSGYNRHETGDPRSNYPEGGADRWPGQARDRFSGADHKRERFDSYPRIPSSAYHRDRDHGQRPTDKRK